MRHLIFAIVLMVGMGGLAFTVSRLVRFMWVGRPGIPVDRVPERLGSVVLYWLLQRKVMERPTTPRKIGFTSLHHLGIFWGFLIVTLGTVELWVNGLDRAFASRSCRQPLYQPLEWMIDVFNLIVLVAIGFGFFRRLVVKPRLIPMSLDAGIIRRRDRRPDDHALHLPRLPHGRGGRASATRARSRRWWRAGSRRCRPRARARVVRGAAGGRTSCLGLAFLNYVPYSKHIHMLGALPNIFFRNLGQRGVMPKLNLEDENDWGVGKIEQFTWKTLLDKYACTECARCSNYCPAYNTDKTLSPMQLIHDMRDEMIERGVAGRSEARDPARRRRSRRTTRTPRDGTTATTPRPRRHRARGACSTRPRSRARRDAAAGRRAHQGRDAVGVHDLRRLPGGLPGVHRAPAEDPADAHEPRAHREAHAGGAAAHLRNIESNSNPWGIAAEQRMDWAEGPRRPDRSRATRIPSTSCSSAAPARSTTASRRPCARWSRCCTPPSVDFAVLGQSEQCTGDPARRAGNENLFQTQAEANVDRDQRRQDPQGGRVAARTASTPSRTSTRSSAASSRSSTTRSCSRTCWPSGKLEPISTRWRRAHLSRQLLPRPLERRVTTRRATSSTRCSTSERRRDRDGALARSTASAAAAAAGACGWKRRSARA